MSSTLLLVDSLRIANIFSQIILVEAVKAPHRMLLLLDRPTSWATLQNAVAQSRPNRNIGCMTIARVG